MTTLDFQERLRYDAQLVNQELERRTEKKNMPQDAIWEAIRYSLLAGGKRIRPVLVLEFCRICGGDEQAALPFACAIEMIHTYSLIHDDLPCMDDDDYRRGRLTSHKVYGEATAVLAGDALLNLAFETALAEENRKLLPADRILDAARTLADFSGVGGMVGGQVIDLAGEGKSISLQELETMDLYKTGALIRAAAKMGCIAGGASAEQLSAADTYARSIGKAFQIQDDILDVTGDFEKLGKKTGSDAANEKSTYVRLLGLEKSRRIVQELTREAVDSLSPFGADGAFLTWLARMLMERES